MTLITFLIFNVVGGDPAMQLAGRNATPEQITSLRYSMGLDQSLFKQYWLFVSQSLRFDWGQSWHTKEKINLMIWQGLGPSLSLTLPAFLISLLLASVLALVSVHHQHRLFDRLILGVSLALMSISFLVYIISFQYFLAYRLGLFPVTGWNGGLWERWQFLLLPWIVAITVSIGPYTLLFRTAIIEQARQDYVLTAKAKGLGSVALYLRHIFRNALVPISAVAIMQIPFLLTGSLLLEAFFNIPGLGGLLMQALQNADLPVIKALTVLGGLTYVFFNLVADLVFLLVDPRVELT